MRRAIDPPSFLTAPIGAFVSVGSAVLWCESPTLVGVTAWSSPTAEDTRRILSLFDHYEALAPRFDMLMDVGRVERVGLEPLELLLAHARANRAMIIERVRRRFSVVPGGIAGLALAGIAIAAGGLDDFRLAPSALDALRILRPDRADLLHAEIESIVLDEGGTPRELQALRALLEAERGRLSLECVAERLSTSTRTLQRVLLRAGTSFRAEQLEARFRAATELLRSSDDKLGAIAAELGVTETALADLIRGRTAQTVGEYRRLLRAG